MSTPPTAISEDQPPRPGTLLAPLWHTIALLVLLLAISLSNLLTHHMASHLHSRIPMYAVTLLWEWALLGLVYWGLRMRRTPLRQLLGIRRAGAAEFWTDIAIGLGFWFASTLTLSIVALALRLVHLHPEDIRDVVSQMAPASPAELAMWIALSISAGICEELIFRGYLQQQFTVITRRLSAGIAIAALIFGFSHGYEGISGMLLIVLYGAFFGILTYLRRSLRAGMFAHAWHDSMSGIVLYFGAHLLQRIPH